MPHVAHSAVALAVAVTACSTPAPTQADAAPEPDAFTRPQPTPPAGLVAWFDCQKLQSNVGNGLSMVTGGPLFGIFNPDGYHAGGCSMDGVWRYDLVESFGRLDFPGAFTIALWVRPDRIPADYEVFTSRAYGWGPMIPNRVGERIPHQAPQPQPTPVPDRTFALSLTSTLQLRYDSQMYSSLAGAATLQVGEWTHVALTYDGTTKRIFVNGALDASGPAPVPVTWDLADPYLLFGADEEPSFAKVGHRMLGMMDDIMLFDRALDASELAALAAQ